MRSQHGQHIRAALQRLLSALDWFGYVALYHTPVVAVDAVQLTDGGREVSAGAAAAERVERIDRAGKTLPTAFRGDKLDLG